MRKDTKNMNRDERGEEDKGASQKETTDNRQSKKEKDRRHGASESEHQALEKRVPGCAKRRRRRQEKRETSQGEHEQEQGTDGRGDEGQEP